MGDNWRSNSAQFGAIFRPSHYFVIQRKTRTRIKREREEQREDNTRRRRRRRRGRRRRSTETHGPGGDAGRASRRPRVRLPVREHRFVSRRGRALFFSSQKRRCATSFTFFVLVVSSFEFAQKRALFTKDDDDDDASLSLSLSLSLGGVLLVDSQILVRAKEIQPERDETEEDWREEEENARAEKRDAETRVIETPLSSSRSSIIEIPNGRTSRVTNYLKAQSNTHNSSFSLSFDVSFRRSFF